MKKGVKKIFAIFISGIILAVLYSKLDIQTVRAIFHEMSGVYILAIPAMLIPIYLLIAWRWLLIARLYTPLSYRESLMQVLSSSALNTITPSKTGSLAKGYFLYIHGIIDKKTALALVIYEKFSDLAAMSLLFMVSAVLHREFNPLLIPTLGLALLIVMFYGALHLKNPLKHPRLQQLQTVWGLKTLLKWAGILYLFSHSPKLTKGRLLQIQGLSCLLWLVHAAQMVLFFYAINLRLPVITIVTYMLCAVFIGLLPVSLAGLGTRDLSIVFLFQGVVTYDHAVFIGGVMGIVRYIIPTLLGIPFLIATLSHKKPEQAPVT